MLNVVDKSLIGTLVDRVTGQSGPNVSDRTIFIFEGGSVCGTIPATPDSLRGRKLFREIRHLPPTASFTGKMVVDRQGGEIKSIEFI
jgi:hypothetical protein